MLGELIREASGKLVGTRVLDEHGKIEATVEEHGRILGTEETTTATFWAVPRSDGTLYGEVNRLTVTKDGEMATSKGSGIGRPKGRPPAASYRAAVFYQTASQKLARLNTVISVAEVEIEEDGNFALKEWEWK